MIKKTNAILALAILCMLCGCQKKPTACFDTTDFHIVGSDFHFTNCSTEGHSYEWDFGDGGTSTLTAPTHTYYAAGTYTVRLTAISEKGRKTDEITKQVTVRGKAAFQYGSPNLITVHVGSETQSGYISQLYSDCYTQATFALPVGTYQYTASEASPGTHTWNGSFTVTTQGCTVIYLP
ncbi:MAG: PKD domain-containing protein [Bacteroidia bacterium]